MKTILLPSLSLAVLLTSIPTASDGQWVKTNGPYGGRVSCLAVSGSDLLAGNYGSGLYRSTDNGITWTSNDTGLTNSNVFTFAASGGNIFAGTADGVFLSTNAGDAWSAVNAGLVQGTIVTSFTISGETLFTGTSNSGIWRRPLSEMITAITPYPKEAPARYELNQNYPNPFNPSTTIQYGLPGRSHVTLTVFNALGQQVSMLANEIQEAGYHAVRFDGSGLASGVYLYRLRAGVFVQSRRLVLLK